MSDASAWGVDAGYHDASGNWREPPRSTVEAVLKAMGATAKEPEVVPGLWIVRSGETVHIGGRWELHTEDGGVERVAGTVQAPPPGYHDLFHEDDGRRVRLIVSPGRCHLPEGFRTWGWALQLYAMRSRESWGMGDLGDLRRFAAWARELGAGLALLNPLHAPTPVPPQQTSPYYPSSRCFRSPLYIRVEDVPGAEALGEALGQIAARGRALNESRTIDRDEVLRLKMEALERVFERFPGDADFDRYVTDQGDTLTRFATYCVLAERHGASWLTWPEEYRDPTSFEVRETTRIEGRRVAFHQWLQWLVDRQLAAAGAELGLMQDLAIGVDAGGADAWMWQDIVVQGISVGAPADEFNTRGQDWGLPPFDPWRLRAAYFEPFIRTVRAGFRHAGGLRFDHVMGLFRLFWIPAGASAVDGIYVRYPWQELLDILALESHRAGAYVVGEDLGTVEPWVREQLDSRDVLSYRLLWFEPHPPREFPTKALAAVTTHDLPTTAGLWTGRDIAEQNERGMDPNVGATEALRARLREWTGLPADADSDEVTRRLYELLAEAPSAVVTAALDDALGVLERPNYPGTVGGTNWSLALPQTLEEIEADPRVKAIAEILRNR